MTLRRLQEIVTRRFCRQPVRRKPNGIVLLSRLVNDLEGASRHNRVVLPILLQMYNHKLEMVSVCLAGCDSQGEAAPTESFQPIHSINKNCFCILLCTAFGFQIIQRLIHTEINTTTTSLVSPRLHPRLAHHEQRASVCFPRERKHQQQLPLNKIGADLLPLAGLAGFGAHLCAPG